MRGAQGGIAGMSLGFDLRDGRVVELELLSEGQKQGVLLACSFIRLGLASSIVLIDSPELHVHVADQARFLSAVAAMGSDAQFIVTTGSSEIMKGARREQVIALG